MLGGKFCGRQQQMSVAVISVVGYRDSLSGKASIGKLAQQGTRDDRLRESLLQQTTDPVAPLDNSIVIGVRDARGICQTRATPLPHTCDIYSIIAQMYPSHKNHRLPFAWRDVLYITIYRYVRIKARARRHIHPLQYFGTYSVTPAECEHFGCPGCPIEKTTMANRLGEAT